MIVPVCSSQSRLNSTNFDMYRGVSNRRWHAAEFPELSGDGQVRRSATERHVTELQHLFILLLIPPPLATSSYHACSSTAESLVAKRTISVAIMLIPSATVKDQYSSTAEKPVMECQHLRGQHAHTISIIYYDDNNLTAERPIMRHYLWKMIGTACSYYRTTSDPSTAINTADRSLPLRAVFFASFILVFSCIV